MPHGRAHAPLADADRAPSTWAAVQLAQRWEPAVAAHTDLDGAMNTQTAQQLHRCARALRRAEAALPNEDALRMSALLAAREEIDTTLAALRRRPMARPTPAVMAVLTVCIGLFAVVSIEAVRLLTAAPAVEVRE